MPFPIDLVIGLYNGFYYRTSRDTASLYMGLSSGLYFCKNFLVLAICSPDVSKLNIF